MKITVNTRSWDINLLIIGGMLKNMHEDGYEHIDLSNIDKLYITEDLFDAFIHFEKTVFLSTKDIIYCFKIAHYLHSEIPMMHLGKEIAKRLKISNKNDVNEIVSYF